MTVRTSTLQMLLLALVFSLAACGDKSGSDNPDNDGAMLEDSGLTGEIDGLSAEQGGAGFESIAAGMGYETVDPTPEVLKYLGSPEAETGGQFRYIITRFPLTFRPLGYGENAQYTENKFLSELCYEPLLRINHVTLEYLPALATHWKISEDKLTYTFRLNPKARFWDGRPVTSEDVIATWELLVDEDIKQPSIRLVMGEFERPVAVTPLLVTVKAKEPKWANFINFATGMPIVSAAAVGSLTGAEFLERFNYELVPGTGEYIINPDDVKKGTSYIFTRRDEYWAKDDPFRRYLGNFDRIRLDVVVDNEGLEYERFKKDEQDLFYFTSSSMENWMNDNDYDAMANAWIVKKRVHTDGPGGSWGISFNMRKPPFDDIRMRQAFTYMLNRQEFINKRLYDEYVPLDSYYEGSIYKNPNNPVIRFNPDKVTGLLRDMGYTKRNQEGYAVNSKGQIVEVTLNIVKAVEMFVVPFQEDLRTVGIKLNIEYGDQNANFKNAMERNFSLFWNNLSGLVFPEPRTSLLSELAAANNNWNVEGVDVKQIDELIAEYDTTFAIQRRIEIIRELDKMQMDMFKKILLYKPKGIKVAHWDRFGMPAYVYERVTQPGDHYIAIFQYWWLDKEKDRRLTTARQEGKALGSYQGVEDINYWADFGDISTQ